MCRWGGVGVSVQPLLQWQRAFQGADDGILLCLLSESSWIDEDTLLSAAAVTLRSHYNVFALHLPPPSLLPPKKKNWNYPPPPSSPPACHWDHEELPPTNPPPSTPHSEHAFLEGSLLFIPSGGLTVNLLHCGEISGSEANVCGYSKWTSIYLTIQPNTTQHPVLYFLPRSPLSQNCWPRFKLLSFPATANWKTPLERLLSAKKTPSLLPSRLHCERACPKTGRAGPGIWSDPVIGVVLQEADFFSPGTEAS